MGILLPGAARSLWALDRKGRVARGAAQRVATPVRLGRFAAGSFGLFVWVGVIGAVGLSIVAAVVSDVRPVVVTSGSMGPTVHVGDVLLVGSAHGEVISAGRIVVFHDPSRTGLTAHRIESIDESGRYVTKGDANPTADSTHVEPGRVIGAAVVLIPLVGRPWVWVTAGDWLPLIVLTLGLLVAGWATRFAVLDRFDPWATADAVGRGER